ncbi:MAG: alpha/beta hydrolase [Nocardioidaceae bacterium]|nr:alpha/beta hydrolase [Nocardioidaceae bacterium]
MNVPMPVVRTLVRTTVKPILSDRLKPPLQRKLIDALTALALLPKGTRSEAETLGGVPANRIITPNARPERALLYLHGGGYTVGSRTTHRAVATYLTHRLGAVGHLLDYRMAPEHPYPAAVEDALAAYRALLDSSPDPTEIIVAGDSAGGGLTLALALRAREEGLPLPAALGLISPWVDLTLTGLDESIDDPLLARPWLERCARDYAGDDTRRPGVSPLFADLAGLPPMVVQTASEEIIRGDVERLVAAAETAGVPVTFQLLEGHWHVSHLFAGLMREATEVTERLGTALLAAR